MEDPSSLFQQDQIFSLLAQNPATAKYIGQAEVCRMISELQANPSSYERYKNDSRIADIASHLALAGYSARPAWPPAWSSYNKTNQDSPPAPPPSQPQASWRRPLPSSAAEPPRRTSPVSSAVFVTAVQSGDLTSVSAAVDANPAALFHEDDFGYTPLHLAAQSGHTHIVNYLLGKGVDVDHKQAAGYSPLHIAVLSDKTSVALTLIENGANVHMKDNEGNTALEYALRNDNAELISVLIEAAMSDEAQQAQRSKRKQENERKRQTAALALPPQVERKIVTRAPPRPRTIFRTATRPPGPASDEAFPCLFGDSADDAFFSLDDDTIERKTATRPTAESLREEKPMALGDLFGHDDGDDEDEAYEFVPKAKEVSSKATTPMVLTTRKEQSPDRGSLSDYGDEEETDGVPSSFDFLFGAVDDDSDAGGKPPLFSNGSYRSSTTTTSVFSARSDPQQTVMVSASTSTSTAITRTSSSSTDGDTSGLLAQIQQLEDKLAAKDRELLAKDDKISILEEDTWCRVCMDKKIETVLLWCGHNILCLSCAQQVQKVKKECPVCAKAITRVVRTYRT